MDLWWSINAANPQALSMERHVGGGLSNRPANTRNVRQTSEPKVKGCYPLRGQ